MLRLRARERVSLNNDWRFMKYESPEQADDKGKRVFLDVDGAMSYAMVWLIMASWPAAGPTAMHPGGRTWVRI